MSSINVHPVDGAKMREIASREKELFVMNTTDQRGKRSRGSLHIPVQNDRGESFTILVPNTWIPIDISRFGNVKGIVQSNNFMDQFNKQAIIVLESEDAKNILNTRAAQEEAAKIAEKHKEFQNIAQHTSFSISTDSTVVQAPAQPSEEKDASHNPSDEKVQQLFISFRNGQINDQKLIDELKQINPMPTPDVLVTVMNSGGQLPSTVVEQIGQMMADEAPPPVAPSNQVNIIPQGTIG